jgi:hypothetical protein
MLPAGQRIEVRCAGAGARRRHRRGDDNIGKCSRMRIAPIYTSVLPGSGRIRFAGEPAGKGLGMLEGDAVLIII